jgi:uncharacterized repeat protein (TIGR01451 family)
MYNRFFSAIVILILILALFTGCTSKEATPTATPVPPVTLSPSPTLPAPETSPSPTGTVAAIPAPTPTATGQPTAEPPSPPPQTTTSPSTPLTVLSIVGGDVYVMRAGTETWGPATVGMTLEPGDSIKAGGGANAQITFFDGSTIDLDESSIVGVSELGIADSGTTTIRLTQQLGKTVSRVTKLADPASRYEVETPAAIAAVRGSIMEVTVDEEGKTIVANLEGDIRIIVDGKEYIIHEGMKRSIIPGYPPGPEEWIVPPPNEYEGGGGGGGSSSVLVARMEVTITAEPPIAHVGDVITYTYYLHNTGDLPLKDIKVKTDITGNATYQSGDNGNSILDHNETWVFTSTYTVRKGDPSPLVATTKVSAMTFTSVTVIDTEIVETSIIPINIIKTADHSRVHEGDEITYTLTVNNTGNTILSNISVSDKMVEEITQVSGDENENGLLDTDETWVFTGTYTTGAEDPDTLVNTAKVTALYNQEQTVTADATASVAILRPGIAIDKTASTDQVNAGDNITYTYTVTNEGNTPLSDIAVSDNMVGEIVFVSGDGNENSYLDLGETWAFTGNYTTGANDPDILVNTANVSGMDALEKRVTASTSASVSVFKPKPGIALTKTAEPSRVHVGDEITYTFTVTNTGNVPLSDISVDDNRLGSIPYESGDENGNGLLDLDEAWVFTAVYTASSDDYKTLVNTAEASGTDAMEQTVSDTDRASVAILKPGIKLAKTAEPASVHVGDNITYTFKVTNTGNTPLSDISVSDNLVDEITYVSGDKNGDGLLDTNEAWIFTASYTTSAADLGTLVNTGSNPLAAITVTGDTLRYIACICGGDSGGGFLDAVETWLFRASYNIFCHNPVPLVNTAEVSGTDALGRTVTASDNASVTIHQ